MALTDKQILEAFHRTEGILHGHFLLTSGRHSDTYMQCAKLFADPKESEVLCEELAERLKCFNADVVLSPAVGGIIMGYEVARKLGVGNYFAERVDGKMTLRRGFSLSEGSKVIVVEDVVTTGGKRSDRSCESRGLRGRCRCEHSRQKQRCSRFRRSV